MTYILLSVSDDPEGQGQILISGDLRSRGQVVTEEGQCAHQSTCLDQLSPMSPPASLYLVSLRRFAQKKANVTLYDLKWL